MSTSLASPLAEFSLSDSNESLFSNIFDDFFPFSEERVDDDNGSGGSLLGGLNGSKSNINQSTVGEELEDRTNDHLYFGNSNNNVYQRETIIVTSTLRGDVDRENTVEKQKQSNRRIGSASRPSNHSLPQNRQLSDGDGSRGGGGGGGKLNVNDQCFSTENDERRDALIIIGEQQGGGSDGGRVQRIDIGASSPAANVATTVTAQPPRHNRKVSDGSAAIASSSQADCFLSNDFAAAGVDVLDELFPSMAIDFDLVDDGQVLVAAPPPAPFGVSPSASPPLLTAGGERHPDDEAAVAVAAAAEKVLRKDQKQQESSQQTAMKRRRGRPRKRPTPSPPQHVAALPPLAKSSSGKRSNRSKRSSSSSRRGGTSKKRLSSSSSSSSLAMLQRSQLPSSADSSSTKRRSRKRRRSSERASKRQRGASITQSSSLIGLYAPSSHANFTSLASDGPLLYGQQPPSSSSTAVSLTKRRRRGKSTASSIGSTGASAAALAQINMARAPAPLHSTAASVAEQPHTVYYMAHFPQRYSMLAPSPAPASMLSQAGNSLSFAQTAISTLSPTLAASFRNTFSRLAAGNHNNPPPSSAYSQPSIAALHRALERTLVEMAAVQPPLTMSNS